MFFFVFCFFKDDGVIQIYNFMIHVYMFMYVYLKHTYFFRDTGNFKDTMNTLYFWKYKNKCRILPEKIELIEVSTFASRLNRQNKNSHYVQCSTFYFYMWTIYRMTLIGYIYILTSFWMIKLKMDNLVLSTKFLS